MFNSTLEILIKAKDEASQVVTGITGKLKTMEPAFKKMAAVGTAAFSAIATVAVFSLKESAEAQADMAIANQTLENSLKNLSGSALVSFQKASAGAASGLAFLKGKMDDTSKSALKLGFDDEAASKSFAKLFQVTKDTAEAQREMQIAMDLSRDKGISLEDATQKLIMVHSGATKQLKAEGIAINENASALDNINTLSETYAGKALAYANTTKGAFDILSERLNNVKQSIGDALAPALNKALAAITPLLEKFAAWAEANPELLSKIILIGGAVAALVAGIGTLGLILPPVIAFFGLLSLPILGVAAAIGGIVFIITKVIAIFNLFKNNSTEIWAGLKIMFQETIGSIVRFFDPLVNVINKIEQALARVGSGIANVAKSVGSKISNAFGGGKAQGGNVSNGSSYLVGEHGPEIFSPGTSGSITPNNKLGGSGSSIVVNIMGGSYLSQDAALDMGDKIIRALQTQMRGV